MSASYIFCSLVLGLKRDKVKISFIFSLTVDMSFTDQVPVAMAVMEDKITTSLVTFYLQPFGVNSENCVIFGHFDPFVAGLAFVAGYLLGINGITISINGIIIGRSSSQFHGADLRDCQQWN